jgi:ketosteroid isomerase-like protein
MHPEITATAVPGWPEPGPFVGRDAALAETKRLTEWGENRYTDIDVVADEGDWVVVAFRWHVRGAGSGIATQLDVAVAVRVKEGRIIEWHNRWSRDEALEAAGLSESAMSRENVERLRRYYEDGFNAFMRGDLSSEAFAELHDPEIEGRWNERTYPDTPQRLQGVSELIAFSEQYREEWEGLMAEPLEVIEAPGHRVLALIRQSGRGRQSGVPITIHFYTLSTIRDGKWSKVEYFRHRADALEAAGLSE